MIAEKRGGCKTAIWKRVHGIDETRGIGFHCEMPCLKEKMLGDIGARPREESINKF